MESKENPGPEHNHAVEHVMEVYKTLYLGMKWKDVKGDLFPLFEERSDADDIQKKVRDRI